MVQARGQELAKQRFGRGRKTSRGHVEARHTMTRNKSRDNQQSRSTRHRASQRASASDGEERHRFGCPVCRKRFSAANQLQGHHGEEHSVRDPNLVTTV